MSVFFRGIQLPVPRLTPPGKKIHRIKIPARLTYSLNEGISGAWEPVGEYPRRVNAGEVLALSGDFPLQAPTDGLVRLDISSASLSLRTEGTLYPASVQETGTPFPSEQKLDGESLRRELNRGGLLSHDFADRPLGDLFLEGLKHDDPVILVSSRDPEGAVDWESLSDLKEYRQPLLEWLGTLLPSGKKGVRPVDLPYRSEKRPLGSYGAHLPFSLSKKTLKGQRNLDPSLPLEKQGVIFLGPATFLALGDWVIKSIPGTYRIFAVRYDPVMQKKLNRNESLLFRLPSGYPLQDFLEEVQGLHASATVVAGSLISSSPLDRGEIPGRSIHPGSPGVYYILGSISLENREYPCTGCVRCNQICPVNAGPYRLVTGAPFIRENCLECGLCDYICDSNIPLATGRPV